MVRKMDRKKMEQKVSLFVNRRKELKELSEAKKHTVIVGYRRMGKTHLIVKHLLKEWDKKTVPVYLDMLYFASWGGFAESLVEEFLRAYDQTRGRNLSSAFRRFSSSLSTALSSVKEIEGTLGVEGLKFLSLKLAFKEEKKDEIELLKGALNFISEFARRNKVSVILVLDEIQNIKDFGKVSQGLSVIRGELQFLKNLRLIISGSLPSFIHSEVLEKSKPFWKQLKVMELGPFESDAVVEAAQLFDVGKKDANKIFAITGGIPDYVIKTLDNTKEEKNVELAFEKVVEDEELFFSSVISALSKAEHVAIKNIAHGNGYSIIEQTLGYPPTAVLDSLIKKGLIMRVEKGVYKIVDPGMEFFLKH